MDIVRGHRWGWHGGGISGEASYEKSEMFGADSSISFLNLHKYCANVRRKKKRVAGFCLRTICMLPTYDIE